MIIRLICLAALAYVCCGVDITLESISQQYHLLKEHPINRSSLAEIWDLNTSELSEMLKMKRYNLTRLTQTCQEDLIFTFDAIDGVTLDLVNNASDIAGQFTLPLLDSWAKRPPAGILRGNMRIPGFFLECRAIHYYVPSLKRFIDGEYYRVFHDAFRKQFDKKGACGLTASYDICLPKSCAEQDLTSVFQEKKKTTCEVRSINQKIQQVDAGTWIVGFIMGGLTLLAILTSIIDYYMPDELRPKMNRYLSGVITGFSFHRNVSDMFKVKQVNKQTGCLNSFRFFSISWVICGHMFMIQVAFENNPADEYDYVNKFGASFYVNAFFSVDTFFFMSGFLVAYTWFKLVKTNRNIIRNPTAWVMFYVHRILRLSPPYYFMVIAQGWIIPTLYRDMPNLLATVVYGTIGNACQHYWWTSMLYINNWVHSDFQCVAVSWYLSADMQMYIASPIILLGFALLGLVGGLLICLAACALSIGMTYYWVYHFHLQPAAFTKNWKMHANTQDDYAFYIYGNPLTRYQPYVIGMAVGYIVLYFRKIRVPRVLNLLLWALSLGGMFGLVAVAYTWNHGDTPISVFASATNNALSRPAWALCLSWIVIACYYDQAGPIGDFLNWEIWYPLGRLSFATYLCHWPLILLSIGYGTQLYQFRNGLETFLLRVLPIIFITNIFSIYWSAVFERPFAKIESLIFSRPSAKPKLEELPVLEKVEVKVSVEKRKSDNWEVEQEEEAKENNIKL